MIYYAIIAIICIAIILAFVLLLMLCFKRSKFKRKISGSNGIDMKKFEPINESGALRDFENIGNTVIINGRKNRKTSSLNIKVMITDLRTNMTSSMFLRNRIDFGRVNIEGYDNFCTVNDPSVSKKHCSMYYDNYDFYISDNNSRNGTKVNGHVISSSAAVPQKFQLQMGNVKLKIQIIK